jgi:hypothetical protein
MILSTHYYVLSLSETTNRLYEAFRGSLIDIQNTWFPFIAPNLPIPEALDDTQLRTLLRTVDHHFAHYYEQDPLSVVLTGTERSRTTFESVTAHPGAIIGRADGDLSTTSLIALGGIVWPIVKCAMATAGHRIDREIDEAIRTSNVAIGIDAVVTSLDLGVGVTLLVESDYRPHPKNDYETLGDADDAVDGVIDKVLALGGNVIFVEDDSLRQFQRIALIGAPPRFGS